jgi:large subunit ribosomal protein L29
MKASDLREKSVDDLRELQKSLARDVFQNRLKNFTNRLDDTSAVRKAKRDLARVVTVMQEHALGIVRKGTPAPAGAGDVTAVPGEAGEASKPAKPAKKAAPKAKVEAKSAAPAEAKPKKTAAKKSSAKADKKGEAK